VRETHKAEGVTLPPDAQVAETVTRYNELLARADDPQDPAELRSLYPWLRARIIKDLEAAAADPGSGKRQA